MEFQKHTIKMKIFRKTKGLNDSDVRKRYAVCCEILKSLQEYYPDCELCIYGSTINGYGTKTSDLDLLFMPSPTYKSEDNTLEEGEIEQCPSLIDIKTGLKAKETLLKMNKTLQLAFVKKILSKLKAYQKMMLIRCRCPIVHFYVPKLKVTSDISCGSKQVVYNTKLFQLFNRIDERSQDLIMYLRHWAKSLAVIQSGILSSYAFTLLVVFFLQNTNPPILPSVMHLIEHSDSPLVIDGWKVAFIDKVDKIYKSTNTACCGKLLMEFFSFYWKFDFTKVISIHYGKSLSMKDFFETNDERIKEFEVTPLCIQDPFILSFNVSRNVKAPVLLSYKQKFYVAKNILLQDKSTDYNELLFDDMTYKSQIKDIFCPPIQSEAMFCCCGLDAVLKNVSHNQKQTFYLNICTDLLDLLQYGLLIDCEVIDKKSFAKNGSSKPENFELFMSVQCAVFNRTYVGRSKVKEISPVDCDSTQFNNRIVREEFVISNNLIQTNPLLTSPDPFFWFICDCYQSNLDHILEDIVVTFIPLTDFKDCKGFFHFLQTYLPKKLLNMLLDGEKFDSNTTETKL